jgi:serine/threonine protein kinase
MALVPGTVLGSCEILDLLGKGGMGEVYRGRDTRLGRDVAIKALPDTFVHDADRIARFDREAQVLASLNHPNIAGIYNLEEFGGSKYLVLELVDGETLADRIDRAPIPPDEAREIAVQIAEALTAAHEKGIVHRDLKPANIKITTSGKVKVLDFGLAKVHESSTSSVVMSNSPTLSAIQSAAGVILGTAAYMSPEQARGRVVDKRADIWAFGCILYEMLTGRMTFANGETISDTLAGVLARDPDWQLLPPTTPPRLRSLLQRCLHKDLRHRWQDIGDALIEIEESRQEPRIPHCRTAAATPARVCAGRTGFVVSDGRDRTRSAFLARYSNAGANRRSLQCRVATGCYFYRELLAWIAEGPLARAFTGRKEARIHHEYRFQTGIVGSAYGLTDCPIAAGDRRRHVSGLVSGK